MPKNALEIVKECAETGDWNRAISTLTAYNNYRGNPEQSDETWEVLPYETEKELPLLCMQIVFANLGTFNFFDVENGDDLVRGMQDRLLKLWYLFIVDTIGCIVSHYNLPEDKLKVRDEISDFEAKVYQIVYDAYLPQLDFAISSRVEELIKNADVVDKAGIEELGFPNGYENVLGAIAFDFDKALKRLPAEYDIGEFEFDFANLFAKTWRARKDKFFEKSLEFSKHIDDLASDFPYFGQQVEVEIRSYYANAQIFAACSIDYDLPEENRTICLKRLKHLVNLYCDCLNAVVVLEGGKRVSLFGNQASRDSLYSFILEDTEKIQKYESDYTHPPVDREVYSTVPLAGDGTSSGGCYVATAVYGSYDCPQVWTLRRYRDDTLAKSRYGRAFIRTYYAISPTLVKWFGDTDWFKKMWKGKLDCMVEKLQASGVEDTPYEDKNW